MVNARGITIAWDDGTTVSFTLEPRPDGATRIEVTNAGFTGNAHELIAAALEATQGFSLVLCEVKALLEQGRAMDFVRDKAVEVQEKQAAE